MTLHHPDTAETASSETASAADTARVLARIREYSLGPTRFMNLLSCFELGIVDLLRTNETGMTASQLADAVGVAPAAVEQIMHLMIKEDFVSHNANSGSYQLAGLATLSDQDLARILPWAKMIKVICLRQLYYLTDSLRAGKVVGLEELYGFSGTLYEATANHADLRTAWAGMMDQLTAFIDPWFFDNVDIPANTKVLDLAGNTGLGAILTYRFNRAPNLHVTCFDFPEKEAEALRNFREHGVAEHCSFIGGNVFEGVPRGFDIVLIKHFLDMFDKENVFRILRAVHQALDVGGQIYVLVPIYPEDVKSDCSVDFIPGYFLGCTMGQGGPQKMATYREWMQACGFEVTKTLAQDPSTLPPDVIPVHGILAGTKRAA